MDTFTLRRDLTKCYHESSIRGLKQAAKWAAELLISLPETVYDSDWSSKVSMSIPKDASYFMAKSCYDVAEYDRAAFHSRSSTSKEAQFIHYYSRYLAAEKKRLDLNSENTPSSQLITAMTSSSSDASLDLLNELRNDLSLAYQSGKVKGDSYLLYVYAIVLLKLDLNSEGFKILAESVKLDSTNWAAWCQLAVTIDDEASLESLKFDESGFKKFFQALAYLEVQMSEEALEEYHALSELFNGQCCYIKTQEAHSRHNLRDVAGAIECFKTIRALDPFRLDSLDVLSNLYYVGSQRAELSSLAHAVNGIDPFRVESCCCIANFYSLRSQHAKAIVYFSRALQLNPKHLSAWTLMGHEYMEMKNTGAAIQAYRSATKCNKRDYRAWYGLGQTYEILKMYSYSLYYYNIARSLRPNDSRMTIAMGDTLEKLDKHDDALKCYWKAGTFALVKLANLYANKLHQPDKAAAAFLDYVNKMSNQMSDDPLTTPSTDLPLAYKYLAHYYLERDRLDEAFLAAQKCNMFPETKDEGKKILARILSLQDPDDADAAMV